MIHRWFTAPCVIFVATVLGFAAPPTVTVPDKVYAEVGDWAFFTVVTDGKGTKVVSLTPGLKRFPADKLKDVNEFGFRATTPGSYQVLVYSGNAEGASEPKIVTVVFGGSPIPPGPVPPGPEPPPVPPVPVAITSFRVFLVYDSTKRLTPVQNGVLFGETLEKALTTATVGDEAKFTWRRIDIGSEPAPLPGGLREAWAAAKPQITSVPAIVLQVNNTITIESLPTTGADAAALVVKYRGK